MTANAAKTLPGCLTWIVPPFIGRCRTSDCLWERRAATASLPRRSGLRDIGNRSKLLAVDRYGRESGRSLVARLPIARNRNRRVHPQRDRKSTRLNSSHLGISYAVF